MYGFIAVVHRAVCDGSEYSFAVFDSNDIVFFSLLAEMSRMHAIYPVSVVTVSTVISLSGIPSTGSSMQVNVSPSTPLVK